MSKRQSPTPSVSKGSGRPRPFQLRSLRTKFLLAFVLVALVGVGTVALVANRVTARQFTLYISRGGQMRAQQWAGLVAAYYGRTGSWEGVDAVFAGASPQHTPGQGFGGGLGRGAQGMAAPGDGRYLIVDLVTQGASVSRVLWDSEGELAGQPIAVAYLQYGAPIEVDGQPVATLLVTTTDLSGQSQMDHRFIDAVNQAVLWAVLLIMLLSVAAAALLARQLVAPLRQLTAAAEAMAAGDLSQQVQVRSQDEVGELGQAFNQMAGDLQAAEEVRRQMTADIAHELRNPLSVIRGNLEAIQDGIYPADAEHLAPVYQETMLLQRLVQDLRLLSLADAGQLPLIRTDVDVADLLAAAVASSQAAAQDRGISIELDVPQGAREALVVHGDADRLRQVIGNLVGNALRYTPAGGRIALRARPDGPKVRITVSDTGQGIAPEELPHVFDRFYRGDTSRDRASGGSGLGLSIARALIEAHGGTIDVQSTPGEGTTFSILL
jgi:signal transduction histidine kinase